MDHNRKKIGVTNRLQLAKKTYCSTSPIIAKCCVGNAGDGRGAPRLQSGAPRFCNAVHHVFSLVNFIDTIQTGRHQS